MTIRQKMLQFVYPVFIQLAKRKKNSALVLRNIKQHQPVKSFYNLNSINNRGSVFDFTQLQGKKVLIVNTASNCGYTQQYKELEELYQQHKDNLEIIAFPSNDFKQQEQGTDEEIERFCTINFGVSFLLMHKSVVIADEHQNKIYHWLSNASDNGWCNQPPDWNFSKYLIDEKGMLQYYFAPSISPLDKMIQSAITAS